MIENLKNRFKYGSIKCNIERSEYKEFTNLNEIKGWGNFNYSTWAKQYKNNMKIVDKIMLDSKISSSIEFYCGYAYRDVNAYLREEEMLDTNRRIGQELAGVLSIILIMAPRIPENVIVYRMVCDKFIEKMIENNKNGIPNIEKGFLSTSLTKDIMNRSQEHYTGHKNVLKIYVKKGTIGVYVNSIQERSEEELLLYPNGYLKLIKEPYEESEKRIFECELFYLLQ